MLIKIRELCKKMNDVFSVKDCMGPSRFGQFCIREIREGGSPSVFRAELDDIAACLETKGKGPRPWLNAAQERYFKEFANSFAATDGLFEAKTKQGFKQILMLCGDSMLPAAYSLLGCEKKEKDVRTFLNLMKERWDVVEKFDEAYEELCDICEKNEELFGNPETLTAKGFAWMCRNEVLMSEESKLMDMLVILTQSSGAHGKSECPWLNAAQKKFLTYMLGEDSPVFLAKTKNQFMSRLKSENDWVLDAGYSLLESGKFDLAPFLSDVSIQLNRMSGIARETTSEETPAVSPGM